MKLLITGGAGYIGSHMVKYAQELGYEVVVLDNFSTGHEWAVKECEILRVNLLDEYKLSRLLKGKLFDGVIHFAAKSLINESIKNPLLYYQNNIVGTINLVNEMLKNNLNNLVFSSTAAIFGNPIKKRIDEDHPKNPINPYGHSKLMTERVLQDVSFHNGLNVVSLRYFNAAGAHESGELGEVRNPETHLIPNVLNEALRKDGKLRIFGNDYPTLDGTCFRDFVHVNDLAQAHLLGLDFFKKNKGFSAFNLGNAEGFSIFDVIKSCERITKRKISFQINDRRSGDPAILVSDNKLAISSLKWDPKYKDIDSIVESAWAWQSSAEFSKRVSNLV